MCLSFNLYLFIFLHFFCNFLCIFWFFFACFINLFLVLRVILSPGGALGSLSMISHFPYSVYLGCCFLSLFFSIELHIKIIINIIIYVFVFHTIPFSYVITIFCIKKTLTYKPMPEVTIFFLVYINLMGNQILFGPFN